MGSGLRLRYLFPCFGNGSPDNLWQVPSLWHCEQDGLTLVTTDASEFVHPKVQGIALHLRQGGPPLRRGGQHMKPKTMVVQRLNGQEIEKQAALTSNVGLQRHGPRHAWLWLQDIDSTLTFTPTRLPGQAEVATGFKF